MGYFNEKIDSDQFALQVKSMAEESTKVRVRFFQNGIRHVGGEPGPMCTYFKDCLNGVTNFVHKHILEHETLKGRACALEFWIHVAHKLLEFGDYNTAMILEAGLQSPVITTKLPRSSHAISDAAKLKVEELASYRLKNSAQLRSAIACDPTAIPDTGLMSKDVIMIVQNHKATLYEHPIIQSKLADLPMRQAMLQSPENDDPQVSAMTQMLKAQADNTSNKELYAVGSQYEDVEKEKSVGTSRLDSRLKRVNTLLSEPLEKAEPTLHLDDEEEAKRIEEISRGLRFATMQSITRAMQHIIENQPFKLSNRYAGLAKSLSELVNLAHYADPISHQVAELKRQLLDLENACGADAASLQELFGGFRRDATEKHDQYRRLLQMNVTLLLKGVIAELESYPTLEERKKIARGDILSILRLNIELDPATQLTPENAALFERFQTLQNSLIASLPNMAENYPEMQAPPAAPMTVKDSIEHWVSQALHHSREHLQEDPTYHYSRTRLNDTIHTQFTDESHALVCTRDYDDMIQHYLNAANTIFTEMYGEDNQQIKDRIQACYDELREELLRECDIDPLMRAYKQECYSTIPVGLTNESHYQKQILEKIELASQYGRKFIAFAVRELYPDSIRGPKDFDKAAQIFVARANDLTAEKARPRLIHEFTVNVNGKHGTQCLSLHEPIQEKTISSQVRAPGELANAGRRSFAVKTGDNVEVVFTARTHCSLSPNTGSKAYTSRWQQLTTRHGALCESIKRRHSTYEALLELIQRIAQDQVDRLPEGAVVGTKDRHYLSI